MSDKYWFNPDEMAESINDFDRAIIAPVICALSKRVKYMWAVIVQKEIMIVMKTRSQAREMAKELGGIVRKALVYAA